jgi:hypothetical protein
MTIQNQISKKVTEQANRRLDGHHHPAKHHLLSCKLQHRRGNPQREKLAPHQPLCRSLSFSLQTECQEPTDLIVTMFRIIPRAARIKLVRFFPSRSWRRNTGLLSSSTFQALQCRRAQARRCFGCSRQEAPMIHRRTLGRAVAALSSAT